MVLAHNINVGDRTQDIRISEDVTFETMLLTSPTLQGLKAAGFYKPSPIQLHSIPLGKCGFDLLLEAKAGTGKTAVFVIIALENIDINKGLQVVILTPTREIAMQIYGVIKQIGNGHEGLCVEVVMGGLPFNDDIKKFKKNVQIVVASPGRLKSLIKDKYIDTSAVRLLIFDEADKLMDKSFQADVQYINSKLPQQKQIIMSSATYPESCKKLISKYAPNAQHICPDSNNVLLGVEQKFTVVKYNSNIIKQTQLKFTELLNILTKRQFKQCLIFCNYQVRINELYKMLSKEKWPAEQLYGQQNQIDRLDSLKKLQEYKCRLLISTDVAARGIDASNVDLVINFESPHDWQTYLHRIGRAGRFGSYGFAVTILSEGKEQNEFKILLGSIKLPFNVTNLWTDSELFIDDNKSDLISSTKDEHYEINDKCLSTLNDKSDKKSLNVLSNNPDLEEGFHKINESFNEEETHDKLETFHELLESFKNNSIADCTSSKLSSTDIDDLSLKKLHLTNTEFDVIGKCDVENNNAEDLNATNFNYCKTDPEKLSTEDLRLPTLKLTASDNSDNEVTNNELKNNSSEDLNKINDEYINTIKENSRFKSDNIKEYDTIDMKNSMKSANRGNNKNGSEYKFSVKNDIGGIKNRSQNFKNLGDLKKSNILSKEHDEVNLHTGMNEALAYLGLPEEFSSSKYNSLNQGYLQTNQFDRQKRDLKCNITKSCKLKDKNQSDRGDDRNKSVSHHSEKVAGKTRNKSKDSQYDHNLHKDQQRVENYNQAYMEWYRSLKLRVKQVELIMYFNEQRKLYERHGIH